MRKFGTVMESSLKLNDSSISYLLEKQSFHWVCFGSFKLFNFFFSSLLYFNKTDELINFKHLATLVWFDFIF